MTTENKKEDQSCKIPYVKLNTKKLNMCIGDVLKRKRKELKIKQAELASKIDCSTAALSRIENGSSDIRISSIIKICYSLQLPLNELFSTALNYSFSQFDAYNKMENFLDNPTVAYHTVALIDILARSKSRTSSVDNVSVEESSTPVQEKSSKPD